MVVEPSRDTTLHYFGDRIDQVLRGDWWSAFRDVEDGLLRILPGPSRDPEAVVIIRVFNDHPGGFGKHELPDSHP